jgi:hypothetical protein
MTLLDLQGLETATGHGDMPAGRSGGGSGLTLLTCHSKHPSNLSVALCH